MSSKHQILIISAVFVVVCLTSTAANECPQYCECTSFTTHNFTKCSNLDGLRQIGKTSTIQSLDCSNIGLTKITNQFDKLINLTQLDLSNNRLSELPRLTRRIKTLNLSKNRFTSAKLARIPKYVQHLNLSHNDITYIPLEFKQLSHLKTLELSGNPINCSCESLEVRNWLQRQHVWTDSLVICAVPLKFKGKPWLQIKQLDNCPENETVHYDLEDNNLMLGDEPIFVDKSDELTDNVDVFESGFFPISEANIRADTVNIENNGNDDDDGIDGSGYDLPIEATTKGLEVFEGSGHVADFTAALKADVITESNDYEDEEHEDDGSGSSGILPRFDNIQKISDENDIDDYDESENEPTKEPDPLNIFGTGVTTQKSADSEHSIETITEDILVPEVAVLISATSEKTEKSMPVKADNSNAIPPIEHIPIEKPTENTQESQGTMILLIILGIALIVLLAFLVFKKKKVDNRNRRDKTDAEAPKGTELMDMDKKALGKPVAKNGNGNSEFIPLMGNKDNGKLHGGNGVSDTIRKDNNLKDMQEPLLKKLTEPHIESDHPDTLENNENEKQQNKSDSNIVPKQENHPQTKFDPEAIEEKNNNKPVSPIPPYKRPNNAQISPVNKQSSVIENGYPPDDGDGGADDGDDDVFTTKPVPVSPRPIRYSPVYSPETGRVKIKLTETPKPRTPLLVTRTRSNAGEIILIPQHPNSELPPVNH